MQHVTREEGHLMVAAIRVLGHRHNCPPTIEAIAELLDWKPEVVRLKAVVLHEVGVLSLIESAYDHHLEVRGHLEVEKLTPEARTTAMDTAMAEFDRKKEEEQQKMELLFKDADHERRHRQRMQEMDGGLFDFERGKPKNPFGND